MPEALIRKAKAAARSARLLFEAGDFDGCANRAYYAMFDVARAYLLARHSVPTEQVKTHSGLLSLFSQAGVKQAGLDPDLGRALNLAATIRSAADYGGRSVDAETATMLLEQMSRFLDNLLSKIDIENGDRNP